MTVDPLAEKYYSISPYAYCLNNPMNAIDPTGMSASPIYNVDGDLLGTDNQGLRGDDIVIDNANFKQNMSHEDALKNDLGQSGLNNEAARNKFSSSYSSLPSRPDYDGVMSYKELLQWGRENGNSPVYLDASKIDLGNLYVSDFKGVGKVDEFLSENTGVEFTRIEYNNSRESDNIISASHKPRTDAAGSLISDKLSSDGYNVSRITHSQPQGGPPSGYVPGQLDSGDKDFTNYMNQKYPNNTIVYRVYDVPSRRYIYYNNANIYGYENKKKK